MILNQDFISANITNEIIDVNYKLYRCLKEFNSSNKPTKSMSEQIKRILFAYNDKDLIVIKNILIEVISQDTKETRRDQMLELVNTINSLDDLNIYSFALRLLELKDLFLAEASILNLDQLIGNQCHPLSLAYDSISVKVPYSQRIKGVLLSWLAFQQLENQTSDFLDEIITSYKSELITGYQNLKSIGININQIFLLIFSESLKQSSVSQAGTSYEERVMIQLLSLGISRESIKKTHDEADASTEFDFFFTYNYRTYGIGAKRTLRERWKQFIKTAQMTTLDVMIEITLGIDLSEEKITSIRNHNVYLFVADEIYFSTKYLIDTEGIFPGSELTLETLDSLQENPI